MQVNALNYGDQSAGVAPAPRRTGFSTVLKVTLRTLDLDCQCADKIYSLLESGSSRSIFDDIEKKRKKWRFYVGMIFRK